MDNENASCAYDGEENAQLSPLQRLPVEIFLHICSFLDGSTLVHGLSLVCTRFYLILKDANSLWKARINHIWPDASYPLLPPARPDKLCWMLSYVAIKQETALWKQQESREKRLFIEKIPGTTVDAVLLMHVNGISHLVYTNDQDLLYKQLPLREKLSHEIENSAGIAKAHQWQRIMDLTTIDNTIYSCGADNTVKSWVLTNTGLVHQRTYNLQRSDRLHSFFQCVSSCPERDLFATGSSCGTIYVFDSRSRNNPIRHYRPHTTYVKRLAMNTEYILSLTTYGKTVSVWDQRAGRTMKSITVTSIFIIEKRDTMSKVYLLVSRYTHVYKYTTGFGFRRGRNILPLKVARAKFKERFRASEILFHRAYEIHNENASDAWMPDNEFHGRHCQNFEPYGSAKAHRYFTFRDRIYLQHGLSEWHSRSIR
ncbi:F-box/WD repeat-containing protein 9-like isoform X1 [Temnothorax nylanderi]|uniref:F-box/WD repeat-containing protein 9-like isoform X1 n=1 Tax=Temnothorax nylanderi TaxID=102681 RepID=UPI003A8BB234